MQQNQLQEWTDAIDQTDALECAVLARQLEFIADMDTAEAWKADGAPSMAAWLTLRRGLSYFTASERVRVAHALEELPRLKALFASGGISFDQLRAVTHLATPQTDGYWTQEAPRHAAAALARMARNAREKTTEEAKADHDNRFLRYRWDPDGNLRMIAHLPGDDGAVVQKALERYIDQTPHDQKQREPLSALRADALTGIAKTSLATDPDTDRATVVLHVDARQNGTGIVALDQGPPVSVDTAQRLLCDSRVQAAAYTADQPIALGRTMRTVPPHVIRVIRFRDGGTCRFPGCTQTTRICYHHLQPWSQGGHTDPSNIIGLCPFHHWCLHEGGWTVKGNPAGRLRFYDPHGRLYEPKPKRLRPDIRDQILGPPPQPPPEEPPLADTS